MPNVGTNEHVTSGTLVVHETEVAPCLHDPSLEGHGTMSEITVAVAEVVAAHGSLSCEQCLVAGSGMCGCNGLHVMPVNFRGIHETTTGGSAWNAMAAEHDGWHDDDWANQWIQSAPWGQTAQWGQPWRGQGSNVSFPSTIALGSHGSLPSTVALEKSDIESSIVERTSANSGMNSLAIDSADHSATGLNSGEGKPEARIDDVQNRSEKWGKEFAKTYPSQDLSSLPQADVRKKRHRSGRKNKQRHGHWQEASAGGC